MGLPRAADFGRVKPLRILTLPCQETKPKGLSLRVWALSVRVIIILRSLFNIRVIASVYYYPILAHFRPQITPSGLVFWQGSVDAKRQRCISK